jgi:hypothetical protein
MDSDLLGGGFDEGSSGELERSMEQEIEGLLELDDFDLVPSNTEQITADLLRAERSGSRTADRRTTAAQSPRPGHGSGR